MNPFVDVVEDKGSVEKAMNLLAEKQDEEKGRHCEGPPLYVFFVLR